MDILVIIFAVLQIIAAFLNLWHFISRRKENKKEEQIYFIILFSIFVLSGINYLFIGISDVKYIPVSYGVSIAFLFNLLAAGIALVNKTQFSKPISIVGLVYSLLYVSLAQAHLLDNWGISDSINTLTNGISGLVCIVTIIIFGYYFLKTRLSPLLGLFIGILVPFVQFMIIIISGNAIPEIYNVVLILTINLIMYLGFKGKLNFFEK
jgi:hypothetical protein